MIQISAVIITFNEEKNIERCLRSLLGIADEIVVLDSVSTDRTKEICSGFNVKFVEQPFLGYIHQKNKALEFASYPIVISLDADEALSETLSQSIKIVKDNWTADGYYFNRLTNYCGKWIHHSDWYPDQKLRLWDTRKGKWDGQLIHEKVHMNKDAKLDHLSGDLLHFSFPSIDHHLDVLQRFTTIMAQEYHQKGKKVNTFTLLFNPCWKFFKSYFIRLGFLDGYYGYVIATLSANATFIKYLKLRELYKFCLPVDK